MIKQEMDAMGWFQLKFSKDGFSIDKIQKGCIRTNCVDCLDRTNVVQSVFARNVLHKILVDAKLSTNTAV